jgi:DNA-binding NarL/FixJ family response regulator
MAGSWAFTYSEGMQGGPAVSTGGTGTLAEATIVWLVEDNEFFRETIQSLLNATSSFCCPQAFSRCEDCLSAMEQEILPDVILLDIGLPGMDGIEGLKHLHRISPSAKVIILTVYDDNEKVFAALCAGASGYLLKDSPKEKLLEAITEVLQGGAPMNPAIARKVLTMFSDLHGTKQDYGLTAREKEILQMMVSGHTKKKIADKMFLSYHTVNAHIRNIYGKLQVNTLGGAVSKAYKENLL